MLRRLTGDASVRAALAILIVSLSVVGATAAAAIWLLTASTPEAKSEAGRLIFASVLPLFGTWVGTVLAFYYARDNLAAATDSTIRLRGDTNPSAPVTEIMTPFSQIDGLRLIPDAELRDVSLPDLADAMRAAKRQRWPIFAASGTALTVIHQSTLDAFAKSRSASGEVAATLGGLLDDPALGPLVTAMGFVGARADVDEARVAMRSVPNCNDVFVTTSGGASDPVVGWITNTLLAQRE